MKHFPPSHRFLRFALLFLAVAAILIIPHAARASIIGDITYSIMSKAAYGISYIIAAILGIGVAIEAWALEVILGFNTQIVNSPPVALGFPVIRYLANLGFVLGVVVIAVTTILRYETYGIKKTLWRLVVAAILVNFSLVIAGAVLGVADQLTLTFLDGVNPLGSAEGSFKSFATAIAGAFNPQKAFLPPGGEGALGGPNFLDASDFGGLLLPLIGLVFSVFSLLFIIIALGALVVMLLVRYVTIGILLILMPLAWVAWAFHDLKHWWSTWWNKFLQQAFFAPVVVFFLWLVVKTSEGMAAQTGYFGPLNNPASALGGALGNFFSSAFSGIIQQVLQVSILLGLTVGGIFAAQKMGIVGAGAAMGYAKSLAGGFGAAVGRRAVRAGTYFPRRGEWAKRTTEFASKIGAPPGAGRLRRWTAGLGQYATGWAARGLGGLQVAGGENQVKHYGDVASKRTDDQNKAALFSASRPEQIAIYEQLAKKKKLDEVDWNLLLGEKMKRDFKRYGQETSYKEDIEKGTAVGSDVFVNRNNVEVGKEKAVIFWRDKVKRSDVSKMQLNDLFGADEESLRQIAAKIGIPMTEILRLRRLTTHGIAVGNYGLVPSALAQLKGRALHTFAETYKASLRDSGLSEEEQKKRIKNLDTSMANYLIGFSPPEGASGPSVVPTGGTAAAGGAATS